MLLALFCLGAATRAATAPPPFSSARLLGLGLAPAPMKTAKAPRQTATSAKILSMEIPDDRVRTFVKVGTGALPIVWTLYGTPISAVLGAAAVYSKLKVDPPGISDGILDKLYTALLPSTQRTKRQQNKIQKNLNTNIEIKNTLDATGQSMATNTDTMAEKDLYRNDDASVQSTAQTPNIAQTAAKEFVVDVQDLVSPFAENSADRRDPVDAAKAAQFPGLPEYREAQRPSFPTAQLDNALDALDDLGTKIDPIKQLAYGNIGTRKKKETEDVFRSLDPMSNLNKIEAPSGEFTLDPLPGGTRKRKNVENDNIFASTPTSSTSADVKVGTILQKLDPLASFIADVEAEERGMPSNGSQRRNKIWKRMSSFLKPKQQSDVVKLS